MTWTWQMGYALAAPAFALLGAGCVWLSDRLFDHLEQRRQERNLEQRRSTAAAVAGSVDVVGTSQSYQINVQYAEGRGGAPDI
jgi:hypothetical protein